MKFHELFLSGFWGFFLLSEIVYADIQGEHKLLSDSNQRDLYQGRSKFKCPFPFGSFHDPEDCSQYYQCISGMVFHRKCRTFTRFDVWRKRCLPIGIAVCGNDNDGTKTTSSFTNSPGVTSVKDNFVCPSFTGNYPHPNDCSMYYSCILYIPSTKTCPKKELFDAVKKTCKPEDEVHCGDRPRPGFTTVSISTEVTQSVITTTQTETITQTIPTATDSKTETAKEYFTDTTTKATSEDIITTTNQPTPPEHDCNEDDADCILIETGDPEDWFKCPRAVGSFPHPSSDKLFIFCMNWIPSAKKCGLDRVYSKEKSTCVDANYFL